MTDNKDFVKAGKPQIKLFNACKLDNKAKGNNDETEENGA